MIKIYTLNLAVYVAKDSNDVSDLDSHFFQFISRITDELSAIEELNKHKSFYLPLKDGYYMFFVYYLNLGLKDLNTGDILDSEFYASASFDNDAAFDNLIANTKYFNK